MRVSDTGDHGLDLAPGARAGRTMVLAMRGTVVELWDDKESSERLGRAAREPHAVVRWDGRSEAAWPLWMIERLSTERKVR